MPRTKNPLASAMAILAKYNIETETPLEMPEANYNHNNAVAMFAREPQYFVMGECFNCKQKFAHNQPIPAGTRVGYCSDSCRRLSFEKSTGVKWGVVQTGKEPWDGDPPMIITPEQLKNLEALADWFTKNRTTLEIADPEPQSESNRDEYSLLELGSPEDSLVPTDQAKSILETYLDEASTSELASLHLEAAQTSPLIVHASEDLLQKIEEDDPFDF